MCASVLCIKKKGEHKGDVSLHCLIKYLVKKNRIYIFLLKNQLFFKPYLSQRLQYQNMCIKNLKLVSCI